MLQYTKKSVQGYLAELSSVDVMAFNRFILTKMLAKCLKFNTLLPILVAIGVVAFSLALQDNFYVFIPQSSITAFASYVIFAGVTSILLLVLYPLAIIIVLNYIGHKVRHIFNQLFFPIKVLVLIIAFYLCVAFVTRSSSSFSWLSKLYVTGLWTLLYFLLINIYITYIKYNDILKFTRMRIIFAVIFVILLIKPFIIIFIYTSQMINYASINSNVYLSQTNCKLITTPIGDRDRSKNMTVNDARYYQEVNGGCYVIGNTIRYGFGGDYVLIFKKNIIPIINSVQQDYNAYVRLTCYAGNCYAQDNVYTLNSKDSINDLIQSDWAKKARKIKSID